MRGIQGSVLFLHLHVAGTVPCNERLHQPSSQRDVPVNSTQNDTHTARKRLNESAPQQTNKNLQKLDATNLESLLDIEDGFHSGAHDDDRRLR